MRRITLLAAAAALLGTAQTAAAQTSRFALDVRGGYAIPTGDWNEDDTFENGFGFGANVMAQVTPQVAVYAGWETFQFKVDEDQEGVEADATDAGFRAGIAVAVPLAMASLSPVLELGVLYNTLEIGASDDETSVEIESDASIGFEAGLGLEFALGQRLSAVPMVRYRRHEVEFEEISEESETIEYIVVGVALKLRL